MPMMQFFIKISPFEVGFLSANYFLAMATYHLRPIQDDVRTYFEQTDVSQI
jgi:hypothetical protein